MIKPPNPSAAIPAEWFTWAHAVTAALNEQEEKNVTQVSQSQSAPVPPNRGYKKTRN